MNELHPPEESSEHSRREKAATFMQSVFGEGSEAEKAIASHLNGIDFSKNLEVVTIPKGTIFVRFENNNARGTPTGNYFAESNANPMRLGIAGEANEGKERTIPDFFQSTRDVLALKSTAADIESWYREGKSGELLYGGETQYFVTEPSAFDRIVDSTRNELEPKWESEIGSEQMDEFGNEVEQHEVDEPTKAEKSENLEQTESTLESEANDPNGYESIISRLFGEDERKLEEGFESPHNSKGFAEELARGDEIKSKLDAVHQVEESLTDVAAAFLGGKKEANDSPLGETYSDWFDQEFGNHPYIEARADAEERNDK